MKKRILVAPLNWGLGHATRCIPIINALIAHQFEPILASDGIALELLRKEFPTLTCIELPGYNIKYSKKGYFLKFQLLKDAPKVLKAINAERKATKHIIETYQIEGIISDNRLGVQSKLVPSIFMTHQLKVLSGNTTWLSTKIHQIIIKKFDECWVPDSELSPNLSGKLGHLKSPDFSIKYIGALSRFRKLDCEPVYDVMVLLSGPEPQRTMLEATLFAEFQRYDGNVLFVKGIIENEQTTEHVGRMTIHNYLIGKELETALNESNLVVSRSGYTTIMDLAKLEKRAFFIPTPGQFEQEYLAKRLAKKGFVPSCKQQNFSLEKLKETTHYKGLKSVDQDVDYAQLFQLFQRK